MEELRNTLSPVVIDLIIAALILLVACLKAKAGIFQSVMSAVVVILAIAIGFVASKYLQEPVSNYAWQKYGPIVEEKFDAEVEASVTGEESLGQVFRRSWNRIIESFDLEFLEALEMKEDNPDFSTDEMIAKVKVITLTKAKLLCDRVCKVALFGIITAIALLVLTIIKNILDKVANFSIVGWANHLLGFVFGLVEMTVILLVIIRFAGMISITFFQELSEGTVLLKWLIGGDINATLHSIQNLSWDDLKNMDLKLEDLTTVDFKSVGEQIKNIMKNINIPKELTETVKDVAGEIIK